MMMVNIGTRVAPVNIVFPSSRKAALIERKTLQYTTLSVQLHHCVLSEIKTKFSQRQTSVLVSQYITRIRDNTQSPTF